MHNSNFTSLFFQLSRSKSEYNGQMKDTAGVTSHFWISVFKYL